MGRGYLGEGEAAAESRVWRMSERRRVLVRDGDVGESRFEGERGLVEGICPERGSSKESSGVEECS